MAIHLTKYRYENEIFYIWVLSPKKSFWIVPFGNFFFFDLFFCDSFFFFFCSSFFFFFFFFLQNRTITLDEGETSYFRFFVGTENYCRPLKVVVKPFYGVPITRVSNLYAFPGLFFFFFFFFLTTHLFTPPFRYC